jgi:Domain of unknown function (DUF5753)
VGDSANPLLLRRTKLRTARLHKELTQAQVARAMDWSLLKMNLIEKAKTGIGINDRTALPPLCGVTDKEKSAELVALAWAAGQPRWWGSYRDTVPPAPLQPTGCESASASQFETMFVPGVLQTEEYASVVLQAFYEEKFAAERVTALVDLCVRRRDLPTGENAPKLSFILVESVVVLCALPCNGQDREKGDGLWVLSLSSGSPPSAPRS